MKKPRLVMIGNGMAGVRTVEELLKIAPDHYDITIFGAEPTPTTTASCFRRYWPAKWTIRKSFSTSWTGTKNRINLHVGKKVVKIDRVKRQVIAEDGTVEEYDRLLLATGSTPFILPIPGNDLPWRHRLS